MAKPQNRRRPASRPRNRMPPAVGAANRQRPAPRFHRPGSRAGAPLATRLPRLENSAAGRTRQRDGRMQPPAMLIGRAPRPPITVPEVVPRAADGSIFRRHRRPRPTRPIRDRAAAVNPRSTVGGAAAMKSPRTPAGATPSPHARAQASRGVETGSAFPPPIQGRASAMLPPRTRERSAEIAAAPSRADGRSSLPAPIRRAPVTGA